MQTIGWGMFNGWAPFTIYQPSNKGLPEYTALEFSGDCWQEIRIKSIDNKNNERLIHKLMVESVSVNK